MDDVEVSDRMHECRAGSVCLAPLVLGASDDVETMGKMAQLIQDGNLPMESRRTAAGSIDPDIDPAVTSILTSLALSPESSDDDRRLAIESLYHATSPSVSIRALQTLVDRTIDESARIAAAQILSMHSLRSPHAELVPIILDFSEPLGVRQAAIRAVGNGANSESDAALRELLARKDYPTQLRASCCAALRNNEAENYDVFISILEDRDEVQELQEAVGMNLKGISEVRHAHRLLELLRATETSGIVKHAAITGLQNAAAKFSEASVYLAEFITSPEATDSMSFRAGSVLSSQTLHGEALDRLLGVALDDSLDWDQRNRALSSLGHSYGAQQAMAQVLLDNRVPFQSRIDAAQRLTGIIDQSTIDLLSSFLEDSSADPTDRYLAALALEGTANHRAVSAMVAFISDTSLRPEARMRAAETLGRLPLRMNLAGELLKSPSAASDPAIRFAISTRLLPDDVQFSEWP